MKQWSVKRGNFFVQKYSIVQLARLFKNSVVLRVGLSQGRFKYRMKTNKFKGLLKNYTSLERAGF